MEVRQFHTEPLLEEALAEVFDDGIIGTQRPPLCIEIEDVFRCSEGHVRIRVVLVYPVEYPGETRGRITPTSRKIRA